MTDAMIFNSWFPILEIVLFWFLRFVYRWCDRGFKCCTCKDWTKPEAERKRGCIKCYTNPYDTKAQTLNQYIEIHVGGIYYMHFKYSAIMNICFVTLMYGFGMPVLYPVAVVSLVILYISEKLLLYYSYRQPPAYD